MKRTDLCGEWVMKRTDWENTIPASVPGTVYTDMLNTKIIPDPYYRDNSDKYQELMKHDYLYTREFDLKKSDLEFQTIELCCDGLDTICEIYINGKKAAYTYNMHRKWVFNIKDMLNTGSNEISVLIKSPIKYCEEEYDKKPINQPIHSNKGMSYIRKAHCMLGWDWAPNMPDGGIWKDIYLLSYDTLKINSVFVSQEHTEDGRVFLNILPEIKTSCKHVKYSIDFDNKIYDFNSSCADIRIEVENPKLWYPAGYGDQYLYDFKFKAYTDTEEDEYSCRIGLRKFELVTDDDEYGTSMYFRVNGIPVFAKGSNYVLEDSVISRYSKERTRKLLEQAIESNQNTLRVWGGAIFPHDYFFDICDEFGIMVWHDLMFACAQYPGTKEFYENISAETEDNVKRIRNHPSLVLWCGNNECEEAAADWWHLPQNELDEYLMQYEHVLREAVNKNDPSRVYLPSSPSTNGDFKDANSETKGDTHYWEIWFNQKPLKEYTKYHFRFLSEFGFQSFPCIESVKNFTDEDDRNIFSKVMECHQKDGAANGKILLYLSRDFKYPKDFDSLVYVSQILQAEAVRVGVEHMRRNRNNFRCMGTIYWQLNDCWPVASWSSIDYYGRRKALHYIAKRFYQNVLLSALYDDKSTVVSLTNDLLNPVTKTVYYKIKSQDGSVIKEEAKEVTVKELSSQNVFDIDAGNVDIYNTYIEYGMEGKMEGAVLLCPNMHFNYKNPDITYSIEHNGGKTIIKLLSKSFANFVELKAKNNTVKFSDNYFAMSPGAEKVVTCDEIIDEVSIRSVYETY